MGTSWAGLQSGVPPCSPRHSPGRSFSTRVALQVYDEPTVLLAKRVTGEEEVPEGAVAVLTPDAPDVLSHVSVRARNMKVLFAICHELEPLKEIEGVAGKVCAAKCSSYI